MLLVDAGLLDNHWRGRLPGREGRRSSWTPTLGGPCQGWSPRLRRSIGNAGMDNKPKWFRGRLLGVAYNPHSALLLLSRRKFKYALDHVDLSSRRRPIANLPESAFCNTHAPFTLWRSFDDLDFHTVDRLDNWAGSTKRRREIAERHLCKSKPTARATTALTGALARATAEARTEE